MQNKSNRIIIDTNLWISFLITKDYSKLDDLLFSKQSVLIFSNELLEEFLEVARRPKFRRFFPSSAIEELLETLNECAVFVKIKTKISVCRDPKDNFLLSLAVDGKADFLLTGDHDLLVLEKYDSTIITTISDFFNGYK
jgi:putative PIN family toxin of toxin-antitoxin system